MKDVEQPEIDTGSGSKKKQAIASSLPAGNRLPPELLAKLYSYLSFDDKRNAAIIIPLALLCKSFNEFFTSPVVWEAMDQERKYYLLQNKTVSTVWRARELNEWYGDLDKPVCTLPGELWRNHTTLKMVLQACPNVVCAPSRDDYQPYSNDPDLSLLLIGAMTRGICFDYLSEDLRGDEKFALASIERFASSVAYCPDNLLANREFVKKAVSTNATSLNFLGHYLEDIEMVLLGAKRQVDLEKARGAARNIIEKLSSLVVGSTGN